MSKINSFFEKAINWVWVSSSNPQSVGLSAKAGLLVIVSALTQVIGLTHLNLPIGDLLNTSINDFSTVLTDFLMFVGAAGTLYGGVRKIWLTVTGKNQAIKPQQ